PKLQVLEEWTHGLLSPREYEQVANHLTQCSACADKVAAIQSGDTEVRQKLDTVTTAPADGDAIDADDDLVDEVRRRDFEAARRASAETPLEKFLPAEDDP